MMTLTVHLKHLHIMVTPHNSLVTRKYKSLYWYHRQFTSKHTHTHEQSSVHTPHVHAPYTSAVSSKTHLPCPTVHCSNRIYKPTKTKQRVRPTSPTALRHAASKHLTTMISCLMQQYTLYHQRRVGHPPHPLQHTLALSYVQTIPNHST